MSEIRLSFRSKTLSPLKFCRKFTLLMEFPARCKVRKDVIAPSDPRLVTEFQRMSSKVRFDNPASGDASTRLELQRFNDASPRRFWMSARFPTESSRNESEAKFVKEAKGEISPIKVWPKAKLARLRKPAIGEISSMWFRSRLSEESWLRF